MQKILVNYSRKSITALVLSLIMYGATTQEAIALTPPPTTAQTQSNQTLKETQWQLSQWSESQPLTDTPITAEFTDSALAGSTGCNRYTTTYHTDGQTLTLSPIATTRKACPEPLMSQEFLFVTALEGAQRYFITPQGQLQIAYQTQQGLGIMTFEPFGKVQGNKIIYVNAQTVPCTGVASQQCLQIRENPNEAWQLFYSAIADFNYQPGYLYQLRVKQTHVPNPPADASSLQWSLVEVISKTPAESLPQTWLERPLSNWNQVGQAIPNPPKLDADPPEIERCKDQIRQPSTPEDRILTRAGWTLFGPVQQFEETSVIAAMSAVDGMCRPLGYQAFVFVEEQFAGTLSPIPMNSRTDGASRPIFLSSSTAINVEYSRYRPSDPLCCPSQVSRASFRIESRQDKPVLVLVSVTGDIPN